MSDDKHCLMLLQTTLPKADVKRLVDLVLASRLSPCIQCVPLSSYYRWQGKLCEEEEVLMSCKVFEKDFKKLQKLIMQNHPYEVPEIIGIRLYKVAKKYKRWCEKEMDKL